MLNRTLFLGMALCLLVQTGRAAGDQPDNNNPPTGVTSAQEQTTPNADATDAWFNPFQVQRDIHRLAVLDTERAHVVFNGFRRNPEFTLAEDAISNNAIASNYDPIRITVMTNAMTEIHLDHLPDLLQEADAERAPLLQKVQQQLQQYPVLRRNQGREQPDATLIEIMQLDAQLLHRKHEMKLRIKQNREMRARQLQRHPSPSVSDESQTGNEEETAETVSPQPPTRTIKKSSKKPTEFPGYW